MDAANVYIWRVWVLDKAIARWVDNLEVEREIATFTKCLQPLNELIELFSHLWIELASLFLHLGDALDRRKQEPLNCLNRAFLGLRRDLEIKLWDANCREF